MLEKSERSKEIKMFQINQKRSEENQNVRKRSERTEVIRTFGRDKNV